VSDRKFCSSLFMLGDCLERMKEIPDASVDMILCDLPYGSTACAWDQVIPFDALWSEYRRVIRADGAVVLTASQPFTTALIASNMKAFAYSWIWNKGVAANFVQARRMPLKVFEDVCVFSFNGKMPRYSPLLVEKAKPVKTTGHRVNSGSIPLRGSAHDNHEGKTYTHSYPSSILEFSSRAVGARGLHPTQKPVALFEYLIRTYTDEGMTVLDNCAGSGTTAIASERTKRSWICIERDPEYFTKACERIDAEIANRGLFS
jgi:site-specific DNA-methyltransferase (adenine-specific)